MTHPQGITTFPLALSSRSNEVEDFFGKGNHQPTGQSEKALTALAGVVALQGQADLHDAPPQQDKPTARISEKMNVERFSTTTSGSSGGKSGQGKNNAAHHDGVQRKQIREKFYGFFVVIQLHLDLRILFVWLVSFLPPRRAENRPYPAVHSFRVRRADRPARCRRRCSLGSRAAVLGAADVRMLEQIIFQVHPRGVPHG